LAPEHSNNKDRFSPPHGALSADLGSHPQPPRDFERENSVNAEYLHSNVIIGGFNHSSIRTALQHGKYRPFHLIEDSVTAFIRRDNDSLVRHHAFLRP
jgi:hypothetical protein